MAELRQVFGVPSSSESIESVFSRLKPFCVRLLDLVQNPKREASFLPEMADLLRRAPPDALQPCLDYTLLPLLLLLDAAVQCRKEKKGDSDGIFLDGGVVLGGLAISDSLAEGVVKCLEELLMKCHLGSVNQMVVVLKKITFGAMLSPSEASEEFREGIIKCFRAMLLRLQPCSSKSCSCKQRSILSTVESLSSWSVQHGALSVYIADPEECLLAFLQSQNASAAVGHWLSLLLQAAEVEASKGNRGSATLRKEAFLTLRVLVAKVGTADALAFFLPGIVSRFAKVLYVTKSMMSGAGGSSGSIEQAVRGLTEFLIIVLDDKANVDGLEMSPNAIAPMSSEDSESSLSLLETLRCLPRNTQSQSSVGGYTFNQSGFSIDNLEEKKSIDREGKRSLYVHRTKEWIGETSANINKLLSATFPQLCVHPSEKVRKALVDGLHGLLSNCSYTLESSKLMLLECLCVLVSDETEAVCLAAQESLESLLVRGEKFLKENEIFDIFTSLIEGLPRVVLGSEEKVALSHARKLLVLMYYVGPDVILHYLSQSSMKAAHVLDCLSISLSQNSQFAGSVNKLLMSQPLSPGYLLSVSELKAGRQIGISDLHVIPKISVVQDKHSGSAMVIPSNESEFPHMPPWFAYIGSHKLYLTVAGVLRLVGLSVVTGHTAGVSLSVLVDILLDHLHNLVVELQMMEYNKEGWRTWYSRNASGQLLRKSSAAVCMLNEMIYGLSHQSVNIFSTLFSNAGTRLEEAQGKKLRTDKVQPSGIKFGKLAWKFRQEIDSRDHVIQCVGSIIHEYLSPELWELPVDQKPFQLEHDREHEVSLHFSRDCTMLQQVLLDGLGIFGVVLGKDFVGSGFLHSSLYLLLRNLICSNSQIRNASDSVLRVLSYSSGHDTVGRLVVANADYIIDSICRQLRHLDLNPHVPNVLAAMLSYVGAAHDILPLLEEPMQAVSLELEVLGRQKHPQLTIPFIKAVGEIAKATSNEASLLPDQAESFQSDVNAKLLVMREQRVDKIAPGKENTDDMSFHLQFWDELLIKLNEMKQYRRIVGSLAGSCMKAAIPLLSSLKESACLVALDIIENVSMSLAKVEEAYKHEKQTKAVIEEAIQLLLLNDLQDAMDTTDEVDENRLLPAMNKIWPYLVLCLKNKISVGVVRRCTEVLSKIVEIGGGDFFIRRFHTDGHVIWKLLTLSPLQRKGTASSDEKRIVLPYRSSSLSDEPMSEISSQKIQVAVLNMIAKISSNKRSSVAFRTVLKKVSGLVVGIACSKTTNLQDASVKALAGLASMDSDLIWLLLADIYYSLNKMDFPLPPSPDLAGISELLPRPSSTKEYLYVQCGGESSSFDIDPSSLEAVFSLMQSEGFM